MKPTTKQFVLNIVNCAPAVEAAKKLGRYVCVMRPSKWGNPFVVGRHGTRTEVIAKYREYILASADLRAELPELRGMALGCVCSPMPCHADVLAELANAFPEGEFVGVETLCKCGKAVHAGHQGTEPVVLHAMPPCDEFNRLEPDVFLRWLRNARDN